MVATQHPDCLFCKIAAGTVPVRKIFEDDLCVAFPDIHPQAPTHFLIVPKEHIQSQARTTPLHSGLLGHLMFAAADLGRTAGLENGYRIVVNTGQDGGQTVQHLHLHLLGGRALGWPPG